jgi:capsular polysaccharide export protein
VTSEAAGRVFLFLQGPHGPFFRRLAGRLATAGAGVRRVAFNPGDEAEWRGAGPLDRFLGPDYAYPDWLSHQLSRHQVTDMILYGDARPEHARAIAVARRAGVLCHCLEEGYLRPHHVTYERWGNKGNSPLRNIPLARMAAVLGPGAPPLDEPGEGWGAHRPHLWHSARYHARMLLPSRRYGRHRSRRDLPLWHEFWNYIKRLAGLPWRRILQGVRARRLRASGRKFHLVLLQLSFDSSMQAHSDYRNSAGFAVDCIDSFANCAPADDLLVFRSHPFEDGRERLGRVIAGAAARWGVSGRVLFLDGGPGLKSLLDAAGSVLTINSTAAQQALWRGLPVLALGRAVYAKPELVSSQSIDAFFAGPRPPDRQAYRQFRQFLTATSQFKGSFYSRSGIEALLAALPAAILSSVDAYDRVLRAAPALHLAALPESIAAPADQPAPAESREQPQPRRAAV